MSYKKPVVCGKDLLDSGSRHFDPSRRPEHDQQAKPGAAIAMTEMEVADVGAQGAHECVYEGGASASTAAMGDGWVSIDFLSHSVDQQKIDH